MGARAGTSPSCQTPHSQCKSSLEPPKPGRKPDSMQWCVKSSRNSSNPSFSALFFFFNFPLLAVELRPVWRGCSPSASRCSCWVFSGTAGICSHKTPQWDELGHRGVAIRMDSASRASSGLLLLMELLQLSWCHPALLRCHPALEMWFQ